MAGTAKRNPNDDPEVPERGLQIAAARAYRRFQREGWSVSTKELKHWYKTTNGEAEAEGGD